MRQPCRRSRTLRRVRRRSRYPEEVNAAETSERCSGLFSVRQGKLKGEYLVSHRSDTGNVEELALRSQSAQVAEARRKSVARRPPLWLRRRTW